MPVESAYPKVDIPDVDIWTFLFERKDREFPENKDADTNQSYTYGQVRSTALNFGKSLKALWNWKIGDVLAIFSPNSIDLPAVIWGTLWAGGIVSPANPAYTSNELISQLKDSCAKAIITQAPYLQVTQEACRQVGIDSSRIILIGDMGNRGTECKLFADMITTLSPRNFVQTKVDPKNDLAFLVYSSGTTGHPKGVMLSHKNVISNILMCLAIETNNLSWKGGRNNQGDILLGFLPFFHIYGLSCLVHHSIYLGLCLVVLQKFNLERFCSVIQDHGITYAYVVPPVVLLLAKSPVVSRYNLSSLRMLNSGAAPLTQQLVEATYSRLRIPIKQGYGLSETSPVTHLQPWESWNSSIGSVGILLPNQTVKYMSLDGTELPIGQAGEIWIKGPNVFKGYLNNIDATENSIVKDGYFRTGDIGYEDKNGNVYITDRLKELIKYKGFQVAPAELEGILISHSDIEDVAIIGVQDDQQATEVPRAYVVVGQGVSKSTETEKSIMEYIEKRVSNHKRLRGGVRFVAEIPKSVSGKILRRALKEHAKAEDARRRQAKL